MRRKMFGLTLSAIPFALCVPAEAQQPKKVPVWIVLATRLTIPSGFPDLNQSFQVVRQEITRQTYFAAFPLPPFCTRTAGIRGRR